MSAIKLSVEHGRTLDEARSLLKRTVEDATSKFGPLLKSTEWSADGNSARIVGTGFAIDLSVDSSRVHLTGDLTGMAGLLSEPIVSGLKTIVGRTFQKRLA